MAVSFTDYFEISKSQFKRTGALDILLDIDTRFFIDPLLLSSCEIHEFQTARSKVENYFSNIITLIRHSRTIHDQFWKRADSLLTFVELKGTCLGYSNKGTSGNAIGPILRNSVLCTIKELLIAGDLDPVILELLGVFQGKFGADRISDLITYILRADIYSYSERTIAKFDIPKERIIVDGIPYLLVKNPFCNRPIIFLPKSILSPLPEFVDFDSIEIICAQNDKIRSVINAYFDLKNRSHLAKDEIRYLLKSRTDFRDAMLSAYKNSPGNACDWRVDPRGEYVWYEWSKDYTSRFPINFSLPASPSTTDLLDIVELICNQFKGLVENNNLWRLLYDDKTNPKHESAAQLLFYGIADSYCKSNNIDLSREVNNGRGPVDFKLSIGQQSKVLVEVKLTSNDQIIHGINVQLPIYMTQENTYRAIYLIVHTGGTKALRNLERFFEAKASAINEKITVIYIDALPKLSASNA